LKQGARPCQGRGRGFESLRPLQDLTDFTTVGGYAQGNIWGNATHIADAFGISIDRRSAYLNEISTGGGFRRVDRFVTNKLTPALAAATTNGPKNTDWNAFVSFQNGLFEFIASGIENNIRESDPFKVREFEDPRG